jgi:hypothetical protein
VRPFNFYDETVIPPGRAYRRFQQSSQKAMHLLHLNVVKLKESCEKIADNSLCRVPAS